jgi:ATPase family AAA domain-containing protein 3A/B
VRPSRACLQVLELAKQQEVTRAQELKTREAEAEAAAARGAADRERAHFEELRKTNAQQAQTKAQLARYEDELARKRMAAEHESARERNAGARSRGATARVAAALTFAPPMRATETVRMQEAVTERQESLRQASEERIQSARRQTDVMKAELERENLRAKALADAEGRAAEARANEDVNRRLLLSRVEAETAKAVAVLQAAATNIGQGARELLTDPRKLGTAVGGVTALALGVYGAREGTRFGFRYLERILGQPSLVRETSRRSPWQRLFGRGAPAPQIMAEVAEGAEKGAVPLRDVVLEHSLAQRVRSLAAATAATRQHGAPFRNMMFYGPPGTGKTLAAKRLARYSGLDYAVLSGGDIAPLGAKVRCSPHI